MPRPRLLALGLTLLLGGCSSYGGSHSFANTRKLLDSSAPDVTRVMFSPFVGLVDALASPVTTYIDAASRAPEDEHVYLSFVGLRTLWASDHGAVYTGLGTVFVGIVDTVWFAAAGLCDVVYALTSDLETPADRAPPLRDLFTPARAQPRPKPVAARPAPTPASSPEVRRSTQVAHAIPPQASAANAPSAAESLPRAEVAEQAPDPQPTPAASRPKVKPRAAPEEPFFDAPEGAASGPRAEEPAPPQEVEASAARGSIQVRPARRRRR